LWKVLPVGSEASKKIKKAIAEFSIENSAFFLKPFGLIVFTGTANQPVQESK